MLALVLAAALAAQAPATPTPAPAPATPAPATPAPTTESAPAPAVIEAPAASAPAGNTPAEPGAAAEVQAKRPKLLVLDVKAANAEEIDAGQAETLTQLVAARAGRFPLEVVSMADLRDLVELEGQKQAVGACDVAATSCLNEIAGALGADLVLATRAGKLDAVYVVSLQLFNARAASAEGRASVEAWSLAEVSAKLGPALDELITKSTGTMPTEPRVASGRTAPPAAAVSDDLRFAMQVGGGVGIAVGALVAGAGGAPAFIYGNKKDELETRTRNFDGGAAQIEQAGRVHKEALDAKALYNDVGRWGVAAGIALVVLGGASLAAGFLLPTADAGAP